MMNYLTYHFKNFVKSRAYIPVFIPHKTVKPEILIDTNTTPTAWKGLELIIEDILNRFKIKRNSCIEFGVEFGYSTVVFSNYFKKVLGIDTFEGDIHAGQIANHYDSTKQNLSRFLNIQLVKSDYRDWIKSDNSIYDFAHVDIIHNYKETFECGLWAVQHSDCTVFHDTESFPEVRKAVINVAKTAGKRVFNYPYSNGLGIVVGKNKKI